MPPFICTLPCLLSQWLERLPVSEAKRFLFFPRALSPIRFRPIYFSLPCRLYKDKRRVPDLGTSVSSFSVFFKKPPPPHSLVGQCFHYEERRPPPALCVFFVYSFSPYNPSLSFIPHEQNVHTACKVEAK